MAGRYQGQHRLRDGKRAWLIEVSWQQNGWFWRSWPCLPVIGGRKAGSRDAGDEVTGGPFTTSTQAYSDARKRLPLQS